VEDVELEKEYYIGTLWMGGRSTSGILDCSGGKNHPKRRGSMCLYLECQSTCTIECSSTLLAHITWVRYGEGGNHRVVRWANDELTLSKH
jgi:hypothetical protein